MCRYNRYIWLLLVMMTILWSVPVQAQIGTSKLTNRSGATVNKYDVVVVDTANSNSFTTTTTEGDGGVVGIVYATTIADDSTGIVLLYGIGDVTITGSASIGDYLITSTTAGSAKSNSSDATGSFGIALEAGTDTQISCLLIIDSSAVALDDLSDNNLDALQDVTTYSGQAAGDLEIWSGSAWVNKAVSGDISLSAAGVVDITHLGIGSLADPNADTLIGWDDSAGATAMITIGSGLTMSGTTLSASGTPSVDLDDDVPILYGTSDPFQEEYASANSALELSDGTNIFRSVVDDGTSATFTYTGGSVWSLDVAVNGGDITSTSGTFNIDTNGTKLTLSSGELQYHNESTSSPILSAYAQDSTAAAQLYGKITCNVSDSTDASEDSYWTFSAFQAGSEQATVFRIDADGDATASGDILASGGALTGGVDGSERGVLTLWDGAGGNTPGTTLYHSPDGTAYYLFMTDTGGLRYHTSLPTSNSDGTAVAGSMTSFTAAGDSGTNQTISDGDTFTVAGGSGVSSVGSATDTITLSLGALTADWAQTGAFDLKLANASSELRIMESAGDLYYGSVDVGDLSADRTYTISSDESGYIAIAPTVGTAGQLLQSDGDNSYSWTSAGTMTSFTLAGDSGGGQEIINGNTATFAGGNGITTVDSATDTVTFNLGLLTGDWSQTAAFDLKLQNSNSELYIRGADNLYDAKFDVPTLAAGVTYTFPEETSYITSATAVGTSGQLLQSDGDGTFSWKTPNTGAIVLTAVGGKPDDGAPCADAVIAAYSVNNVWVLDFDAATDESAWWMLAMPDDYAGGTLTPTFYYSVASDWVDATDKVNWAISGVAFANSEALSTALGTVVEVNDVWTTGETSDELLVITGSALTLAGTPAAGEFVTFQVYRDADDATNDTCTADGRLIAVKLEYTKN